MAYKSISSENFNKDSFAGNAKQRKKLGKIACACRENFGFRQFCLRGLEGARIEINIVSIVHNLKKIWKVRGENIENRQNIKGKRLFYTEMKVIVRQRQLLSDLTTERRKAQRGKIRRILSSEFWRI